MKKTAILLFALLLTSCNQDKIAKLESEVSQLRDSIELITKENTTLTTELEGYKYSPDNLCANIDDLYKQENVSKLNDIKAKLTKYHPTSAYIKQVDGYIASIKKAQADRAAAEKAKRMQAVNILQKKYDDVRGITFYQSKRFKQYGTHFKVYIGKNKSDDVWIRLFMQYHGDDWIFFKNAYLSYDENTIEIDFNEYGDKETEVGGGVYEWIDVTASESVIAYLRRMVNGKSMKWRLSGKYMKTYTFTSNEIEGIREILLAYDVLVNGE